MFDRARFRAVFCAHVQNTPLRALAREIGVSASTLSRIANGEVPDIDTLATILAWMHRSADEFFISDAEEKRSYNEQLVSIGYALYALELPESLNEAILSIIRTWKHEAGR